MQILHAFLYILLYLHTFFFNFNNILLGMVESLVSSSLFLSGGDCLWWLMVNVGSLVNFRALGKFCGFITSVGCIFVHLFFLFFWKSQNSQKKQHVQKRSTKLKKKISTLRNVEYNKSSCHPYHMFK